VHNEALSRGLNRSSGGQDHLRHWGLIAPLLLLVLVMFLLPIGRVLWFSVTEPSVGLQNYSLLLSSSGIRDVLWNTARICFLTTAISVGLGYIVAYMLVQASSRQFYWMMICILVPLWVSVLVRTFAWLTLLQANGLVNQVLIMTGFVDEPLALVRNEFGVIVGMVHYMLPYAILVLYAGMAGIDDRLVKAARGLGARPTQAFVRVFLPLSLPGIFGATLLVLIFSLGFYVTPIVLGGGKTIMIAEQISVQILQTANWGAGTMLASVLLLSVFLLLALAGRFFNVRSLFGG
jgi:putative spermidine/putrescine transport system permease protein